MTGLSFENVSLQKGRISKRKVILDNISFSLEQGYLCGIAGKNGAGKTTLFETIISPESDYSGRITWRGMDIRKRHAEFMQYVGHVSEDRCYPYSKSLGQIGDLFGPLYREWDRGLYLSQLAAFGLSPGKEKGGLSRGENLKFQLAFAVGHHAKLYLLDEVTAGMDVIFRREFFELSGRLLENEEVSVLMTTHIEQELDKKMDYIGILEQGRLVSFGENGRGMDGWRQDGDERGNREMRGGVKENSRK